MSGLPQELGPYVLEQRLAASEDAEVFLAVERDGPRRRCVVKTLRAGAAARARLADEARLVLGLDHGNVVRGYDAGEIDGAFYIAMEFVDGRTLADVLAASAERRASLPLDVALYVAERMLEALRYLHGLRDELGRPRQVVHGDLTPSNVLLGFDGGVKVADFGGARGSGVPDATQGQLTTEQWAYLAPEQASGEAFDARADLYAVGAILFEMVTGERLVERPGQVPDLRARKPTLLRDTLPLALDHLISSAVAPLPQDRFADAGAMLDVLRGMSPGPGRAADLTAHLRLGRSGQGAVPAPVPSAAWDNVGTVADTGGLESPTRVQRVGPAETEADAERTRFARAPNRARQTQVLSPAGEEQTVAEPAYVDLVTAAPDQPRIALIDEPTMGEAVATVATALPKAAAARVLAGRPSSHETHRPSDPAERAAARAEEDALDADATTAEPRPPAAALAPRPPAESVTHLVSVAEDRDRTVEPVARAEGTLQIRVRDGKRRSRDEIEAEGGDGEALRESFEEEAGTRQVPVEPGLRRRDTARRMRGPERRERGDRPDRAERRGHGRAARPPEARSTRSADDRAEDKGGPPAPRNVRWTKRNVMILVLMLIGFTILNLLILLVLR